MALSQISVGIRGDSRIAATLLAGTLLGGCGVAPSTPAPAPAPVQSERRAAARLPRIVPSLPGASSPLADRIDVDLRHPFGCTFVGEDAAFGGGLSFAPGAESFATFHVGRCAMLARLLEDGSTVAVDIDAPDVFIRGFTTIDRVTLTGSDGRFGDSAESEIRIASARGDALILSIQPRSGPKAGSHVNARCADVRLAKAPEDTWRTSPYPLRWTCPDDVSLYAALDLKVRAVGYVRAGTSFVVEADRHDGFTDVSFNSIALSAAGGVEFLVETADLAGCTDHTKTGP